MGEPTKMLTLAEYKALKATAAKAVAELNALRKEQESICRLPSRTRSGRHAMLHPSYTTSNLLLDLVGD